MLASLCASAAHAAPWKGRLLTSVLDDLRASGITVLYSDQTIASGLSVDEEPIPGEPLVRLQQVLRHLNLSVRQLGINTYAIVAVPPTASRPHSEDVARRDESPSEVVVQTSRYRVARSEAPGKESIAPDQLKKLQGPSEDALRILQLLPGSSAAGLSARSHVRGGYEDELAVRFDGVQLFNPFHLKDFLGLFGLIDPEVVGSIDYYSGGFPARFGGRNSATMDIRSGREGDSKYLLSVSELYSRAIGSGSFAADRGDWLVGYRRSNLSVVLNALDRDVGTPNFDDLLGRVTYALNDVVTLSAGVLALTDRINIFTVDHDEQVRANYRDTYGWLSLNESWSYWLTSRVQITHADLTGYRNGASLHPYINEGALYDSRNARIDRLSTDWTAKLNAAASLDWGVEINEGQAHYDYSALAQFSGPIATAFRRPTTLLSRRFVQSPEGWQYGAYASLRLVGEKWSTELGARWDDQSFIHDASRTSPRFAVRYQIDEATALRVSAGRYVQPQTINELGVDENTFRFYKPESLKQIVLGADHQLSPTLTVRLETYWKWIDDIRPRYESLLNVFSLLPDIAVDRVRLKPDETQAYGVEFYAQQNTAPWGWWASYSLSRVIDVFGGASVKRSWDQPQSAKAGLFYGRTRWKGGANISWHSGWPDTPLTFNPSQDRFTSVTLGPRNSVRFANYSSLDLNAQYSQPLRFGSLEYFVELRNALNRMNECCRNVNITAHEDGTFTARVVRERWLSRVPIAGVNWRF